MKKNILLWLFTAALIMPSISRAKFTINSIPVQISFINEAIAIPFTNFFSIPVHPGFIVGTEIAYINNKNFTLFESFNFGYFNHYLINNAFFINTEIGVRGIFNFGLYGEITIGVGYLHTFSEQGIYVQDASGSYVTGIDYGRPRFMPSITLAIGYDFRKLTKLPITIFLRYSSIFEIPYAIVENGYSIPLMPHILFQFGASYYFNIKNTGKPISDKDTDKKSRIKL